MKYLIVDADFRSTGLRDEFEGELDRGDLNLPDEIWDELSAWVKEYSLIVPMDDEEREENSELIKKLDAKGLQIKIKIENTLSEKIKIKYYSEGLLKYINN